MRFGKVVVLGVVAMLAALAGRADAATTFVSLRLTGLPEAVPLVDRVDGAAPA